mmetsp:Transcript_17231/g.31042  ORF Transcript_17231/g.31042 Transcript_17231/m.31042 type:complete len:90 (-) Transcript_17231:13033-13302(-)
MWLTLLFVFARTVASVRCIDGSGNTQKWWAAIKLPSAAKAPPLPGKSFTYFDETHLSSTVWPNAINDTSFLTKTLAQLNDDSVSVIYYK